MGVRTNKKADKGGGGGPFDSFRLLAVGYCMQGPSNEFFYFLTRLS